MVWKKKKKKKNNFFFFFFFFLYFHIREVLSHSRECGSRAAFPGGSRMIREGSHVCIYTKFKTKLCSKQGRNVQNAKIMYPTVVAAPSLIINSPTPGYNSPPAQVSLALQLLLSDLDQ